MNLRPLDPQSSNVCVIATVVAILFPDISLYSYLSVSIFRIFAFCDFVIVVFFLSAVNDLLSSLLFNDDTALYASDFVEFPPDLLPEPPLDLPLDLLPELPLDLLPDLPLANLL